MLGTYLIVAPPGQAVPADRVAALTEASKEFGCPAEEFAPAPNVWARQIYRKVTDAPASAVTGPTGQVRLFLHGEVYNCDDLAGELGGWPTQRRGIAAGPDIAAAGIERRGIRFAEKLNGSFLLLAWRADRNELLLANDRYGLRPHYWAVHDNCLLIAPSVRALLAAGVPGRIDRAGLAQFLAFDVPSADHTLIDAIRTIPPAVTATLRNAAPAFETYWDYPFPPEPSKRPEADVIAELADILVRAVGRRIETTGRLGVPLSGGLDSRTLITGAVKNNADFDAFTFGHPDYIDRRLALKIARRLGVPYYTVHGKVSPDGPDVLDAIRVTDGMILSRHFHAVQMLSLLKEHVSVVLDGLGGGTITGGLIRPDHLGRSVDAGFARLILYQRFLSRAIYPPDLVALGLFDGEAAAEASLLEPIAERVARCSSRRQPDCLDYASLTEWHRRYHLQGNLLLRQAVEVRVPLYDYDLIDFMIQLPPELRYDRHAVRMALKRLRPDLARIGLTPQGVPADAVGLRRTLHTLAVRAWRAARRGVRKFTAPGKPIYPSVHVKLKDIPEFVERRLSGTDALSGRFLRLDTVRRWWQDHQVGAADNDLKLSAWLTFDLWCGLNAQWLAQ